tara:strand:- start:47929 stop:48285 length:357 start_codon:yes stop_codon:yes gene_type:complete
MKTHSSIGLLKTCKGEAEVEIELQNSELLIGYSLDCGEDGDVYNETENLEIRGTQLFHSEKAVGEINDQGFHYKLKFEDENYTESGSGKIDRDGRLKISLKGHVGIIRLFKYKATLTR